MNRILIAEDNVVKRELPPLCARRIRDSRNRVTILQSN
jgi:hypothetical protein